MVACVQVCAAADRLRAAECGDEVAYVVNRNINYTNVCTFKCTFCAFSKGRASEELRGAPYLVTLEEVSRRTAEAWDRGATEVCMQGGIHPDFTGDTYLRLLAAAKAGAPDIHVHAFSPLEVAQGAATCGLPVPAFLSRLQSAGLGSLPGTAAEVLDDSVRKVRALPPKTCPEAVLGRGAPTSMYVGFLRCIAKLLRGVSSINHTETSYTAFAFIYVHWVTLRDFSVHSHLVCAPVYLIGVVYYTTKDAVFENSNSMCGNLMGKKK
jgi:hypothetical protein